MRLVDADGEYNIESSDNTGYNIKCKDGVALLSDKYGCIICEFILDAIPVAYDVDKACRKINENKDMDNLIDADHAIKIVKFGGIE